MEEEAKQENVFEALNATIAQGEFELVSMLKMIDVMAAEGKLTVDEREQLVAKARENADASLSLPPVEDRLAKLELKVSNLEAKVLQLGGESAPTVVPDYDAFTVYQSGMRCKFEGKVYEWVHVNPGNWSPKDYPAAWKLVTDSEA